MPVLLLADIAGTAEPGQLRQFTPAAPELCKPREGSQADDVVPELDGVLLRRQPTDDGAIKRDTVWRLEVQDRNADALALPCQRLARPGLNEPVVGRVL